MPGIVGREEARALQAARRRPTVPGIIKSGKDPVSEHFLPEGYDAAMNLPRIVASEAQDGVLAEGDGPSAA